MLYTKKHNNLNKEKNKKQGKMEKNNNAKFHQSIIINLVTFAKVNLVLCTTNGQKFVFKIEGYNNFHY